ncbi:M10 family metallopeptidase C-terminal domain-containing protein [Paramylibacter kogurei]|nr:M10 family metallopeptidase C-terminal domain-containing protein [Amylibacter kogurei]
MITEWTPIEVAEFIIDEGWDSAATPVRWNVSAGDSISVHISGMSNESQQVAMLALGAWTSVTGIEFTFVNSASAAQLDFSDTSGGPVGGWSSSGGYIISGFVHVDQSWINTYGSGIGDYGFQTYIHEIGHALGIAHPGHYESGGTTYETHAEFLNDSWQMTVMSYFSQTQNTYIDATRAFVVTPMIADIHAAQLLYGDSNTIRTGNTTYGENGNAGNYYDDIIDASGPVTFTIIDDGGIDTLRLINTAADQYIDMRGGGISDVYGLVGNMVIYTDTVIENLYLGRGNDTVTGNEADNYIRANTGYDTIYSLEGNDTIYAQDGHDAVYAGDGDDIIFGGSGADIADGGDGDDIIETAAGGDEIYGGAGNDYLNGNSRSDSIYGGTGNDTLWGEGGRDDIRGGHDDDTIYGGNGADILDGELGNNTIYGGSGRDVLYGGSGDDIIYGGAGGRDQYFGGSGADEFIYQVGDNNDQIYDFQNDIDLLDLSDFSVGNVWDYATEIDGDVVFNFGNRDILTVEFITIAELSDDVLIASP